MNVITLVTLNLKISLTMLPPYRIILSVSQEGQKIDRHTLIHKLEASFQNHLYTL